jgi:hypothetical protein
MNSFERAIAGQTLGPMKLFISSSSIFESAQFEACSALDFKRDCYNKTIRFFINKLLEDI